MAKLLLENGADVNPPGDYYYSPLCALRIGELEIGMLLSDKGTDVTHGAAVTVTLGRPPQSEVT
jgi:hypothetical protein